MVGDRITVVLALGPAKGAPLRREFAQVNVLPSSQGLALESFVPDLAVTQDGDIVRIGRPEGLALSPLSVGSAPEDAVLSAPRPAIMPALIHPGDWPNPRPEGFLALYNLPFSDAATVARQCNAAATTLPFALALLPVAIRLRL